MTAQPDPARPGPSAWIDHATGDLRAADHVLATLRPCPFWLVAYHGQQAAEKALKAYLVHRGKDHPHTHDLRLLLDECDSAGATFIEEHRDAERIGPLGVLARYPSLVRSVTEAEARWAVDTARRLVDTIRAELE